MNPAPESEDWLEAVQSRRLPPEELARLRRELATRPREAARLDDELALNVVLDGLPVAPVPSNFAARVLEEVERGERATVRRGSNWTRWLTGLRIIRPIAAVAVCALVLTGWWQFRLQQRTTLATNVTAVSQAAGASGGEWLRDFDAIQLLRTTAQPGDVELLVALDTGASVGKP
jgi:anti-sigma factor RsiW